MSQTRAMHHQRVGRLDATTKPVTRAATSTPQPEPAQSRGACACACACGGGCPRCRPALRAALGDRGDDGATAPAETTPASGPAADAPAPAPAADASNDAEALDDSPCPAGKTDITTSNKTVTAHGFTVQDAVEDATSKQGGHVASVLPVFDKPYGFCPNASTGKPVQAATVTVTEVKTVPTWAERGQFPAEAQAMWDRYVAVVDGHENDHIAIDTKVFTDMHKKAVGKKPADATATLDRIASSADAPNAALDKKEGCIKLNGGTGKVTKEPRANC